MGRSAVLLTTSVVVRLPVLSAWSAPSMMISPGVMVGLSLPGKGTGTVCSV